MDSVALPIELCPAVEWVIELPDFTDRPTHKGYPGDVMTLARRYLMLLDDCFLARTSDESTKARAQLYFGKLHELGEEFIKTKDPKVWQAFVAEVEEQDLNARHEFPELYLNQPPLIS